MPAPTPMISQHERDTEQLNSFDLALHQVNMTDPGAHAQLEELEAQVKNFRQELFTRDYNAMELLKHTEDLQAAIAAQKAAALHY